MMSTSVSLTLEDIAALYIRINTNLYNSSPLYNKIRSLEYDILLSSVLVNVPIFIPDDCRLLHQIAVNVCGRNIIKVPDKYITYELLLLAVKRYGEIVLYIGRHFRQFMTRELCMEAIRGFSRNIILIPEELITDELCKEAIISSDGDVFQYIAWMYPKFVTTELCELTIKVSNGEEFPNMVEHGSQYLTLDICKMAVEYDEYNLDYVPYKFKNAMEEGERIFNI